VIAIVFYQFLIRGSKFIYSRIVRNRYERGRIVKENNDELKEIAIVIGKYLLRTDGFFTDQQVKLHSIITRIYQQLSLANKRENSIFLLAKIICFLLLIMQQLIALLASYYCSSTSILVGRLHRRVLVVLILL
jgi:hypothetical protein